MLRRPFGSRVAETLLRRLETLLEEASDEETAQALQLVRLLLPDAIVVANVLLADRDASVHFAAAVSVHIQRFAHDLCAMHMLCPIGYGKHCA